MHDCSNDVDSNDFNLAYGSMNSSRETLMTTLVECNYFLCLCFLCSLLMHEVYVLLLLFQLLFNGYILST